MLIKVADIPEEGLGVELSEDAEGLGSLGGDASVAGPANGRFFLKLVGQTVVVTGSFDAIVGLECSRCGKAFETAVKGSLAVDLNPVGSLTEDEEHELHSGDMEVGYYSGGEVDLTGLLAEQVALSLPMKPLCSEGCRGVCQYCGQDLNEKDCGCEPPAGHPGFEGLRGLLESMKMEGEKEEDGESD